MSGWNAEFCVGSESDWDVRRVGDTEWRVVLERVAKVVEPVVARSAARITDGYVRSCVASEVLYPTDDAGMPVVRKRRLTKGDWEYLLWCIAEFSEVADICGGVAEDEAAKIWDALPSV